MTSESGPFRSRQGSTNNPVQQFRILHQSAVAEAKFRGMLEVAPDAMVTVDNEGRIVLVNGQAEALFGYRREELLGERVEMLLPDRFRVNHTDHRSHYVGSPRIRPMGADLDLWARRKDGSEFPVEISLGPVDVDGELQVMTAIRDVTERRQTEAELRAARAEAEQANEAKNEFLSRMSHELRTPLNSILGFGQLLALDPLNEEQRDATDHILRAGRHLLELINEVLDISRIEAGHLSLSPEPVQLDEVLREAQDLVRPLAQERNILLAEEAGPQHAYVLADGQRLKQILLNLLANAVKYNRDGGGVTVSCVPREEGRLRIAVRDTGPGIEAERLPRLFTPFERLGAEQSGVEGTGLGLAVSKRLSEVMGGSMGVESKLGEGSTFWIELATTESPAEAIDQARGPGEGHPVFTEPHTVLCIEDNVDSSKLMERIFSRWPDVRLLTAIQGRIGLELARQHRPDLVLLDLHLPDIPGLEVLQRLRADESTSDIPIVITSADATRGQIERLRAAGADEYLTKPLDIPRFTEVVRKRLE